MDIPKNLTNLSQERLIKIIASLKKENAQLELTMMGIWKTIEALYKARLVSNSESAFDLVSLILGLDEGIDYSEFSQRVAEALQFHNIRTLRDLVTKNELDIEQCLRRLGYGRKKGFAEIKKFLEKKGLRLNLTFTPPK